jgi:hypothetical protein
MKLSIFIKARQSISEKLALCHYHHHYHLIVIIIIIIVIITKWNGAYLICTSVTRNGNCSGYRMLRNNPLYQLPLSCWFPNSLIPFP